jgi:ribosomal protein S18 acetylase RimI-like enzyme
MPEFHDQDADTAPAMTDTMLNEITAYLAEFPPVPSDCSSLEDDDDDDNDHDYDDANDGYCFNESCNECYGRPSWVLTDHAQGCVSDYGEGHFHITDVKVHADYRGQGFGRPLMDAIIARAAQEGATHLTLDVDVENEPAVRLYKSCGFTIVNPNAANVYRMTRPI